MHFLVKENIGTLYKWNLKRNWYDMAFFIFLLLFIRIMALLQTSGMGKSISAIFCGFIRRSSATISIMFIYYLVLTHVPLVLGPKLQLLLVWRFVPTNCPIGYAHTVKVIKYLLKLMI